MRLLPYLHPLWQIGALAVGLWALRMGLRLRALRRQRLHAVRSRLVQRHARAGLGFVAAIGAGYAGGPLILGLVRAEPVFESGHSFFASLTLLLLLFGGTLGFRLWKGRAASGERNLHAFCMGLALFLALVTATLGLGLLP